VLGPCLVRFVCLTVDGRAWCASACMVVGPLLAVHGVRAWLSDRCYMHGARVGLCRLGLVGSTRVNLICVSRHSCMVRARSCGCVCGLVQKGGGVLGYAVMSLSSVSCPPALANSDLHRQRALCIWLVHVVAMSRCSLSRAGPVIPTSIVCFETKLV
jgi:hypothetical protein